MPNYLVINTKDGTTKNLSRAGAIIRVDELLCNALSVPCDPHRFYREWVDTIGFSLALGADWARCREVWKDSEHIRVIDWLEENTITDCYSNRHWPLTPE